MAQVITVASFARIAAWLGWRHGARLPAGKRQVDASASPPAADHRLFGREIYKAPANDFLHGAADLTFGILILGLGFFMLMWVIATG
jgi:hypothetical protein